MELHVLIGLEGADLVVGELCSEAFDEGEFVGDFTALVLDLLLCLVELLWGGARLEGDLVESDRVGTGTAGRSRTHVDSRHGWECWCDLTKT